MKRLIFSVCFLLASMAEANAVSYCTPGRAKILGLPEDYCQTQSFNGSPWVPIAIFGGAIVLCWLFYLSIGWVTKPAT